MFDKLVGKKLHITLVKGEYKGLILVGWFALGNNTFIEVEYAIAAPKYEATFYINIHYISEIEVMKEMIE